MALVGFDRVCVQQFETMLLYRNGRFEKALPPGRHRIRAGSRQIARIDRRPEIFRLNQGTVSTDRFALNLIYVVRTQIVDPRATFESTQNYRDEICMRLQSVVKAMCSRKIAAGNPDRPPDLQQQRAEGGQPGVSLDRLRMPDLRADAGGYRRARHRAGRQAGGRRGAGARERGRKRRDRCNVIAPRPPADRSAAPPSGLPPAMLRPPDRRARGCSCCAAADYEQIILHRHQPRRVAKETRAQLVCARRMAFAIAKTAAMPNCPLSSFIRTSLT